MFKISERTLKVMDHSIKSYKERLNNDYNKHIHREYIKVRDAVDYERGKYIDLWW